MNDAKVSVPAQSGDGALGLRALWPAAHAGLIGRMAWREVKARTRGSLLGMGWWVLTPLMMLAVYTLVLRHVLGVRWGTGAANTGVSMGAGPLEGAWAADLDFALRLYAGLSVFAFFSEVVIRTPRLIADVPHLVKKVMFPLEVLPWVSALTALVPLGLAAVLLLLGTGLSTGRVPVTALALPLVWLPLVPLVLGLGWIFSAVGTYIRDVAEVIGLALGAVLFLSPVFYDTAGLPPALQGPLGLNPLAVVMTQTRQVVLAGQWPAWESWAGVLLASLALAALGAWLFARVRSGFADVV